MPWTQVTDPLHHIALSAGIAFVPILVIFYFLIIKKAPGHIASLLTLLSAVLIVLLIYRMPFTLIASSALNGALYGLFPICWIILNALFLFNLTVKSGQFEIIKNFMASVTPDRRLQALLIAFSFGAFLEGTGGFGAPVAISASILIGLGFDPLYAAGICLIANTSPVPFGSIGTATIMASKVSDIPEMAVSQMIGRTLPILSLILPMYLSVIMCGWNKSKQIMPAIFTAGFTFAFVQWYSSNYLGPYLPDVLAGIATIFALMVLLKYWKPKENWRFDHEPPQTIDTVLHHSSGEVLRAWSPFIVMSLFVIAWGIPSIKTALNHLGFIKFDIPGLKDTIYKSDGNLLAIKPFEINYLSATGTAVLLADLVCIPVIGLSFGEGWIVFKQTLRQLIIPAITVSSVLAFAFVANYSGMSTSIAKALASTGTLFPFFSPILGWLGVFLTGSDTSSNALFCKLQSTTADAIGVHPVVTVAANASGGVAGKMISPQSIAIAAASVGLTGKEHHLFRFTIKHSFIMLIILSIITLLQAYVFKWLIPVY